MPATGTRTVLSYYIHAAILPPYPCGINIQSIATICHLDNNLNTSSVSIIDLNIYHAFNHDTSLAKGDISKTTPPGQNHIYINPPPRYTIDCRLSTVRSWLH